jgi:hypothetical protein
VALAVSVIVALSIFPPWHTVIAGNGWPEVGYRWFLSPPPPLGEFPYRVDLSRLATRYAVVVASLVFGVGCVELFRWIIRGSPIRLTGTVWYWELRSTFHQDTRDLPH